MKVHYLILSSAIFLGALVGEVRSAEDCVSCGQKEVSGMPASGKKIGVMEKIAKKAAEDEKFSQKDLMERYCLTFKQLNPGHVGSTLKEMEATPYPIDDYFKIPQCQPDGYSDAVKSPLLHLIVDDPNARESFLKKISMYYSIKRKKPELFLEALNAKNTEGETFLDYIESMKKKGKNIHPNQIEFTNRLIQLACDEGAVYSFYKDKTCKKTI